MLEIETKFYLGEETIARQVVLNLQMEWIPGEFEVNRIFDFEDGRLRQSGALVRVRERAGAGWLTYKEKTDQVIPDAKVRIEYDSPVGRPDAVIHLLDRLGLREVMSYERIRARYAIGEGTLEMDGLPGGWFCEIEGPPEFIRETVKRAGLAGRRAIVWSYPQIFLRLLQRAGLKADAWTTQLLDSTGFTIPAPGDAFWQADEG